MRRPVTVVVLIAVLACACSRGRKGATTTDAGTTSAVPRAFTCDRGAVTADAVLASVDSVGAPSRSYRLVLRPSGTPCANHLVLISAAGETVLSSVPGMILLADAHEASGVQVVCFSNERHSAIPGAGEDERYSDSVAIECALSREDGLWTTARVTVPPDATYAAWVSSVQSMADSPGQFTVRWLRDSHFQFLHSAMGDRPPTDGVYETVLVVGKDGLTVGATTKRDEPMFTPGITIDPSP